MKTLTVAAVSALLLWGILGLLATKKGPPCAHCGAPTVPLQTFYECLACGRTTPGPPATAAEIETLKHPKTAGPRPPQAGPPRQARMTPDEIPGWFDFQTLYDLEAAHASDDSLLVEIGCWRGKSIAHLATACKALGKFPRIVAVDTWRGSNEEAMQLELAAIGGPEALYRDFLGNLAACGVLYAVQPLRMTSLEAAATFADGTVDFAFIDASHDYESVKADILAWRPKLKPGGHLAGHDVGYETVRRAVVDVLPHCAEMGSCWVFDSGLPNRQT